MELKDKKLLLVLQMKKAVEMLEGKELNTASFDQLMLAIRKDSIKLKKEFKMIRASGIVPKKSFIQTPIKEKKPSEPSKEKAPRRIKPQI
ncbi:hypothetical protein [Carnobacterium maltaromaticum]|uniref:hypothetical protein n=1 Tax=Carnobacterium maltaromaticum TaxID=2751 RepID=UPI0039B090C2